MMNKEAIEYVVGLGKEQVVIEAANGGQYTPGRLSRITAPVAAQFETHTLTSVVDYIKSNIDKLGSVIVHVVSPVEVDVMSALNSDRAREQYISSRALLPNNIKFNTFMDTESFNIMMQSSFVTHAVEVDGAPKDYRKMLLKVTGCVKDELIKQVGDDGVSQSATIKTGVASIGDVVVPNPVMLSPYRTFQEVEQPLSSFIFRMTDGPKAALFEADGGMWKNDAIESIKGFLSENLKEFEGVHILA